MKMKMYIVCVGLFVLGNLMLQTANAYKLGDEMVKFKGVSVKSNIDTYGKMGNIDYVKYPWQCAELVKRFDYQVMGVNLYKPVYSARHYYVDFYSGIVSGFYDSKGNPYSIDFSYLRKSGLVCFSNGGTTAPRVGDIIVYDDAIHDTGHVGIMSGGCVDTVEQNWSQDGKATLTMVVSNGNYTISARGNHSILGWLHMPIGEFSNGWHFDSDIQGISNLYNLNSRPFTVCYQANGGNDVLGYSTGKVHQFPTNTNPYYSNPYSNMRKAWVQDFYSNGKYYTLVINEYVLNLEKGYMGVAYPIGGQQRAFWLNNYWLIGYPVTNEYYCSINKKYIVQWYERLDEEYYVVIYDTSTGNIWYENGNTTTIPKEKFNQHKLLNSTTSNEGVGGGYTLVSPINIQSTSMSLNSIQLTWTPNNGDIPVSFNIYRKKQSDSGDMVYLTSTSSSSYLDTNLDSSQSYCYQITAVYSGIESNKSSLVCASTSVNTNTSLPVVDFSIYRTMVYVQSIIFFTDKSTGAGISSWLWNFGDGTTSNTQNTFHRYNTAGHYNVNLTVTNSSGSKTLTKYNCIYILSGSAPSIWTNVDIGNKLLGGYVSYDSATSIYTIDGAGAGIDETNTQFTYMTTPWTGDVELTTRVLSQTISDPNAKAGIMIMETASVNSSYVMVGITQGRGLVFQYKQNGMVTTIEGDNYNFPVYLKLRRVGNVFDAFYSYTKTTWTKIGTVTMGLNSNINIGLFSTPANASSISTATFDNFTYTSACVIPKKTTGFRIVN